MSKDRNRPSLANSQTVVKAENISTADCLAGFAQSLLVHQKASLVLISTAAVCYVVAAYLMPDEKMKVSEVTEALQRQCLEKGLKKSATYKYIGLAKGTAVKLKQTFQYGGPIHDIAVAKDVEAATNALLDYFAKVKVPGFAVDGVTTVDRLFAWTKGKSYAAMERARDQAAAKREAEKGLETDAAIEGLSDEVLGNPEAVRTVIPAAHALLNKDYAAVSVDVQTPIYAAAASIKGALDGISMPDFVSLFQAAKKSPCELAKAAIAAVTTATDLKELSAAITAQRAILKEQTEALRLAAHGPAAGDAEAPHAGAN